MWIRHTDLPVAAHTTYYLSVQVSSSAKELGNNHLLQGCQVTKWNTMCGSTWAQSQCSVESSTPSPNPTLRVPHLLLRTDAQPDTPVGSKIGIGPAWLQLGCCCCSVAKLWPTLCDTTDCNMPGFPVPHHLPEFAQVQVHSISEAIQPSHLLSPSSPSTFNLSQRQGLFQWTGSSHQVAKVLELQLQHQSFQWLFRVDLL